MSDLRKAAEQALEALEGLSQNAVEDCGGPRCRDCKPWRPARAALTALRAALDSQEDEPVASQSQTHLLRWAHTKDDAPQTEYQRGYDAARRWVQEVGLPALEAQEPTRKAATMEEVYAAAVESEWAVKSEWSLEFRDGFRAAERFHNIKQEGET